MRITLEHKVFKTFFFTFNGVVVVTLMGLAIYNGPRVELFVAALLALAINLYFIKEYKKLRTLFYEDGVLRSVMHDGKEELIDLKSLSSITLTGGHFSHFFIYEFRYADKEKGDKSFLTAPLKDDAFNRLLKDISYINKESDIKRSFP